MRKTIAAFFVAALIVPLSASALTSEEIQARIASLLARIAQLQLQLQALGGTVGTGVTVSPPTPAPNNALASNACPVLLRTLSRGMNGNDVAQLQSYLKRERYLNQAYSPGIFDVPTETAVQQWQFEHGIVQGGSAETTGYGVVGPRSRALIALNCRERINGTYPGASITVPPQTTLTCPIAPPPTTACATGWQAVTDHMGCTLSYKCSVPLGAGGVQSGCPVHQMPLCGTGSTAQWRGNDANGCSLGYQCVNIGTANSLTATPSSGAAPLTVAFSARSDTPLNIDFGDGTSGGMHVTAGTISPPEWRSTHTYSQPGTYTATAYKPCSSTSLLVECSIQALGTVTVTVSGASAPWVPQAVENKYNELANAYRQSLGAFMYACETGKDAKFKVTGSGGFSGVRYYYDESGNYLGTTSFQDVQPFTIGTPPFTEPPYTCMEIKRSSAF